jgi:hypothetical protein
MDDRTHLTNEIRAAREEKLRRERHEDAIQSGGITPQRDTEFLRLRTLSVDELTAHIERLQRDLEQLGKEQAVWTAVEDRDESGSTDVEGDT